MHLNREKCLRRIRKARMRMRRQGVTRLVVHRTPRHIYAQIIADDRVLATASTLEKELRTMGSTGNKEAAARVGTLIGERALAVNIKKIAFDRSGFKYHGRVQALADAARAVGLSF